MATGTAPRLYCIPATEAPIAAVFRRGPTNWSHVGRWDLHARRYEPGAWLGGRVFPRRSDLSPDGRVLCYFAHKPTARWQHGDAYVALSKLPWLTALHAFGTCGTWTRGFHFIDLAGRDPDASSLDVAIPGHPYGVRPTRAEQFATERRRGWRESADSPVRDPEDTWDQRRNARMEKPQPNGRLWLRVESLGWAGGQWSEQGVDGMHVHYWLEDRSPGAANLTRWELTDLQWADWAADGLLLAATRAGALQIRQVGVKPAVHGEDRDEARDQLLFEHDLAGLDPAPTPAPEWARSW